MPAYFFSNSNKPTSAYFLEKIEFYKKMFSGVSYNKNYYQKRREKGLCICCNKQCDVNPMTNKYFLNCGKCREKISLHKQKIKFAKILLELQLPTVVAICSCGRETVNFKTCYHCREKKNTYRKEKRKIYQEKNICFTCGDPKEINKISCEKCLRKRRVL
jgi:hypothetical protein